MEFVGSKYDDCFEVRLVDKDTGVTHLILSSSINTATWTPISAINFAGGDDTAYQTGLSGNNVPLVICSQVLVAMLLRKVANLIAEHQRRGVCVHLAFQRV